MHRPAIDSLRVILILAAAALVAACVNNRDVTGSVTERAAFAARIQQPVSYRELNPPPSPVEIRAQCWMRYERDVADLDTKTTLVQKCVSDRTGAAAQ
ncbi:MAG: hypothetical protein WD207_00940 [Xanthobacteraceae bacterium]